MRISLLIIPFAALGAASIGGCNRADEATLQAPGHDVHDEAADEHSLSIPAERRAAEGIVTAAVERRALGAELTAPGEVRTNAYRSALVTPRITAQIIARRARLGDTVVDGQPLVALSSVSMAEAQGTLIEADREWKRVRELGRDVVSEARYVAAEVAWQRSYASVAAYGMTDSQIDALLANSDASRAMGRFELLSPRSGTVIRDDFVVGELIEPGRVLFEISDESTLWVTAQLPSVAAARVRPGAAARVSRDGTRWLDGTVVQLQHRLDETTRTQGVRIEVENPDDELHAGDYVDVIIATQDTIERIAVPSEAVVLLDGGSAVFGVRGDELQAHPVEPGASASGWTEIRAGLAEGDEVVVRGAFLVKSLLLKSQMGEGHAH